MPLADVALPAPRLEPPAALQAICSTETYDRAAHAYGQAYRDVVRALPRPVRPPARRRRLPARRGRGRARAGLGADAGAAVIPYGGGTSVVGGVEPRVDELRRVTLDLRRARPRARGGSGVPRGAHPGRGERAAAGGRSSPSTA